MQVRNFEKECSQYEYLANQIDKCWQDKKKDEFFQKHINHVIEPSKNYIYYCDKLLVLLYEANNL